MKIQYFVCLSIVLFLVTVTADADAYESFSVNKFQNLNDLEGILPTIQEEDEEEELITQKKPEIAIHSSDTLADEQILPTIHEEDEERTPILPKIIRVHKPWDVSLSKGSLPTIPEQDEYSPRSSNIDIVMGGINGNFTLAIERTVAQLESTLFPDDKVLSKELSEKLFTFKTNLINRMTLDLQAIIRKTRGFRKNKESMTPDELEDFSDILHHVWEKTLKEELEKFKETGLTSWVKRIKKVWKGAETKVAQKIQKFKSYISKNSLTRAVNCPMPSKSSEKTNSIEKRDTTDVAYFIAGVLGVIVLAIEAPFVFVIAGAIFTILFISNGIQNLFD